MRIKRKRRNSFRNGRIFGVAAGNVLNSSTVKNASSCLLRSNYREEWKKLIKWINNRHRRARRVAGQKLAKRIFTRRSRSISTARFCASHPDESNFALRQRLSLHNSRFLCANFYSSIIYTRQIITLFRDKNYFCIFYIDNFLFYVSQNYGFPHLFI